MTLSKKITFFLKACLLVVISVTLNYFEIHALDDLNIFQHKTSKSNFSLSPITSIKQDSLGFMWFGTRKGIFRFNGVDYKDIPSINMHLDSLTHQDVKNICFDKNGNLWIGSNKGLDKYNPVNDKIETVTFPHEKSMIITDIILSLEGDILFSTPHKLYVIDSNTENISPIKISFNLQKSIEEYINCVYQSRDRKLWVGTENGLFCLIKMHGEYIIEDIYHNSNPDNKSIISNTIYSIIEDKKQNLWIGTSKGLDYFERDKKIFNHYTLQTSPSIVNEFVRTLTIDKNGRLWAGTFDGISVIDTLGNSTQIKYDLNNPLSLTDNKIVSLYSDISGCVWVGTYFGGANYWHESNTVFRQIDSKKNRALNYNVVSALAQDKEGKLYIGTDGEGINIFNKEFNTFEYINELKPGLKIGTVKSLYVDGDNLIAGTFQSGLFYVNLKTKKYLHFTSDTSLKSILTNNPILSIKKYYGNNYLVGTRYAGIYLLDLDKKELREFYNASNQNRLTSTLVWDKNGNLWEGNRHGLSVLYKDSFLNGNFNFFDFPPIDVGKNIGGITICEDNFNTIWVGTGQQGLYRLKNSRMEKIKLENIKAVFSILFDGEKHLWITSDQGIIKYNTHDDSYKIFNESHGLKSNNFQRNAAIIARDGNFLFGGSSGITIFNPDELNLSENYDPKIVLSEFSIFNTVQEVGAKSSVLDKSIEYTKEVYLKHHQNMFTIHYAYPNFTTTTSNRFQYRLIGFNQNWINTHSNAITYTLTKPGNYIFEIRKYSETGLTGKHVTRLNIHVSPPFWSTWWAFSVYAIFILLLFTATYRFVHSKAKLKNRMEQESREYLQQQKMNEQKLQFFTNISHEFRTPLTIIIGSLQAIIEEYKGSTSIYRMLLSVNRNANQLLKLINELMDFRKLEKKQMKLSVNEMDVVEFLKEIFLSFKPLAENENYTYSFYSEEETLNAWFDSNKLEKVFYNLLSNAFKFTPKGGKIKVLVSRQGEHLSVSISDNGIGMPNEVLTKIFDRFYEVNPNSKNAKQSGTGIGLTIVENIVNLHQGSVKVESEPDKGSTFTVKIPIGCNHFENDEFASTQKSDCKLPIKKQSIEVYNFDTIKQIHTLNNTSADKKFTIVIAEDNPDVMTLLYDTLSSHFNISIEENGINAYKRVLKLQPDLIISDVLMPEMDGIELCKKIKTNIETSHIPIILLTARTSLIYKYEGLQSGADEYINKPFDTKELLLKCKNILNTQEKLKHNFYQIQNNVLPGMTKTTLDEELFAKAIKIIEQNIDNERFGIMEFCSNLLVSRAVLFRKVKAWTGKTPNELILHIRMQHAVKLFERYNYQTSEVSRMVGFKDPSYFSNTFKKYHNLSPKDFTERFIS